MVGATTPAGIAAERARRVISLSGFEDFRLRVKGLYTLATRTCQTRSVCLGFRISGVLDRSCAG